MKDRIGTPKWRNLPVVNPTQNAYVRFVTQPQAGLKDTLAKYRKAWNEMTAEALRSRIEEIYDD